MGLGPITSLGRDVNETRTLCRKPSSRRFRRSTGSRFEATVPCTDTFDRRSSTGFATSCAGRNVNRPHVRSTRRLEDHGRSPLDVASATRRSSATRRRWPPGSRRPGGDSGENRVGLHHEELAGLLGKPTANAAAWRLSAPSFVSQMRERATMPRTILSSTDSRRQLPRVKGRLGIDESIAQTTRCASSFASWRDRRDREVHLRRVERRTDQSRLHAVLMSLRSGV